MTANPSGDPRLDPAFQRKQGMRQTAGMLAAPIGKAKEMKVYDVGGRVLRTKALSRYLVVGVIDGKLVLLHRCKTIERATQHMRDNIGYSDWRWLRVVDQKTREVLYLRKGEVELERWEER